MKAQGYDVINHNFVLKESDQNNSIRSAHLMARRERLINKVDFLAKKITKSN